MNISRQKIMHILIFAESVNNVLRCVWSSRKAAITP
jgi:hypothetical protein